MGFSAVFDHLVKSLSPVSQGIWQGFFTDPIETVSDQRKELIAIAGCISFQQ
jgi:hypothetical protein